MKKAPLLRRAALKSGSCGLRDGGSQRPSDIPEAKIDPEVSEEIIHKLVFSETRPVKELVVGMLLFLL